MADKDKFVNIADLKAKLRYWCKTRGMTKASQDSLMETINRIPYTVKADIEATLGTTENEIEMLRNQLEIAHAHITRLESKYEGVANGGGEDNG
jgi:5-bromo-4-chloroindolyl phosphate hydrolysis protein